MMTSCPILSAIQHYQRSIDRSAGDEQRLLHCISKLYNLSVKVEHLQMTGIGKTVNSLRKYNGEICVAAKALVTKWKAMVAAEDDPINSQGNNNKDENNHSSEKESSDDQNENWNNTISNSTPTHKRHSNQRVEKYDEKYTKVLANNSINTESHKTSKNKTDRKHKSREREDNSMNIVNVHRQSERDKNKDSNKYKNSDNVRDNKKDKVEKSSHHKPEHSHQKHSSSSSKSTRDNASKTRHQHKNSSTSNERTNKSKSDEIKNPTLKHSSSKDIDKLNNEKIQKEKHQKDKSYKDGDKKSSHSSSVHSSSSKSSNQKSNKNNTTKNVDRKRRHNADNEKSDTKLPKAKIPKIQNNSDDDNDDTADGFDSSMGANFNDILGMLNMPTVKSKKSCSSTKTSQGENSLGKSSIEKGSKKSLKQSPIDKSKTNYTNTNGFKQTSTSKSSLSEKPNLLSSTAKLEPLDPSIALELPTTSISTNYKPMPLNQTVMDCVFKTSNSSASKSLSNITLSEAEAITHGISSKTMRTKIYSGVKTGQILQVPSLFDLCIRILQKHIDALEYTGGVPFEVLRPVLERANPQQLLVFEDYNPYLMEDTDILWQQHCQRNYRLKKRQEMESWREMFLRCQDDEERRLNILAESIKQSQKIIAAPIRKTQLAFVDSMVKPPRNIQRKQEQYGTKSKITATPAARVAALSNVTPNAVKSGDSRLRVAQNVRDHAQVSTAIVRPKKAPLMAKTLQFMRGRLKR